jgi:hypothetical protein
MMKELAQIHGLLSRGLLKSPQEGSASEAGGAIARVAAIALELMKNERKMEDPPAAPSANVWIL